MRKLRLLLLVGLMFAVGGTLVARGQDGSEVFSKQDQKSNSKHEKSKTNDGHRKHWYSPPHWFHRKHDTTASGKVKKSDTKTVAAKNQPVAKPVAATTSASKSATHSGTKTVATSGQHKGTVAGARRRTATTQAKKTVKNPCTPEQARKTGCHLDKGSKGSGAAASGKSS